MTHHILIVDNDPLQCRTLDIIIKKNLFYDTTSIYNGKEAIEYLSSEEGNNISLLLLDLSMPDVDGMTVLRSVKTKLPELPVVIYTAHGNVQSAIDALREGATEFIEKQDGPERIKLCIERILKISQLESEVTRLKRSAEGIAGFSDIIGSSEIIHKTIKLAREAAGFDIPIMINGPSGVGKELFARAIHSTSKRSGKSFVPVNCGAIPENLVESILFGHEKGSFTGAIEKTIGKFREADGGTLFLDEIGELKPEMQVKLLRALQQGEVEPVGATKPVKVNVRLITATNRDLKNSITDGSFREDLYYRINVFSIHIPPLKERAGDIPELLDFFALKIAQAENKNVKGVSDDAKNMLSAYDWPGNVRHLQNAVYRAVVMTKNKLLSKEDFAHLHIALPQTKTDSKSASSPITAPASSSDNLTLTHLSHFRKFEEIEEEIIRKALDFYKGHISEVARRLGIGRSTLYRKMQGYGISEPEQKE